MPGRYHDIFPQFRQDSPIYGFGVSSARISFVRFDSRKLELRKVSESALAMDNGKKTTHRSVRYEQNAVRGTALIASRQARVVFCRKHERRYFTVRQAANEVAVIRSRRCLVHDG